MFLQLHENMNHLVFTLIVYSIGIKAWAPFRVVVQVRAIKNFFRFAKAAGWLSKLDLCKIVRDLKGASTVWRGWIRWQLITCREKFCPTYWFSTVLLVTESLLSVKCFWEDFETIQPNIKPKCLRDLKLSWTKHKEVSVLSLVIRPDLKWDLLPWRVNTT